MPSVRDMLIYKPDQFIAEYELACFIRDIATARCDKIEPETTGLLHRQPDAILAACNNPLTVLTGAAGTGKSTTTKKIVDSFQKAGMRVAIACPTGKAAKRSDEIVNSPERIAAGCEKVPCSTVHRLLKYEYQAGGFTHHRHHKFNEFDVLIVDEFPFLGNILARDLFEAIEPGEHRVVLTGDPNQLPPVDPGSIGRDLMDIEQIPCTRLDVVLRQGANSGIVQNANRVLRGKELTSVDPVTGERFTDCFFTPTKSEEHSLELIMKWVKTDMPGKRGLDPIRDVQVLSPGKKSLVGTKSINEKLRALLNTSEREALGFKMGDKVINTENNRKLGIVNGDVGIVVDMRVESIRGSGGNGQDYTTYLIVDFGEGAGRDGKGRVEFDAETVSALQLALSFTVHKSQGSEFPAVILPLHMSHASLLDRNMLYTAMTRPRKLLCMLGDPQALAKAIWNDRPSKRRTRLRSILNSMFQSKVA